MDAPSDNRSSSGSTASDVLVEDQFSRSTRLALLGLGNFGTALARCWIGRGHQVSGWTVEEEVYESIVARGINEKYLPGVELPGLTATRDVHEALDGAEVVILAVPSSVVLDVVDQIVDRLQPEQLLLDVAKGLGPNDQLLSTSIAERVRLAGKSNPVAVLVGPTIAPELARGVHTEAIVAGEDAQAVARLVALLSTESLHLRVGTDPTGVELWGAFKNVIAILCGIADGLPGGGDNLKAALFTRGYREATVLLDKLGADPLTGFGPAGIGDLLVTVISPHGRNRSLGERLGSGMTLEAAMGASNMVAEGVRSARMFRTLAASRELSVPVIDAVNDLLDGRQTAQQCVSKLLEPAAQDTAAPEIA